MKKIFRIIIFSVLVVLLTSLVSADFASGQVLYRSGWDWNPTSGVVRIAPYPDPATTPQQTTTPKTTPQQTTTPQQAIPLQTAPQSSATQQAATQPTYPPKTTPQVPILNYYSNPNFYNNWMSTAGYDVLDWNKVWNNANLNRGSVILVRVNKKFYYRHQKYFTGDYARYYSPKRFVICRSGDGERVFINNPYPTSTADARDFVVNVGPNDFDQIKTQLTNTRQADFRLNTGDNSFALKTSKGDFYTSNFALEF